MKTETLSQKLIARIKPNLMSKTKRKLTPEQIRELTSNAQTREGDRLALAERQRIQHKKLKSK